MKVVNNKLYTSSKLIESIKKLTVRSLKLDETSNISPNDSKSTMKSLKIHQDSLSSYSQININKDSIFKKLIKNYIVDVFNIFSLYNEKESFYFSQRIIISILISLFTLVFCVFQVMKYSFDIISTVIVLENAISNNIFGFINQICESLGSKFNYVLSNEDLEIYYVTIHKLILILSDFQTSIKFGLIVANIIISLIFGVSL